MELIGMLIINALLYIVLLIINLVIKSSFDKKLENYRTDNQKAIDLFRDELFKKSRRFELKYDIYKTFAWNLTKIHWIITYFDPQKSVETFESIGSSVLLVKNFYGEKVNEKLLLFGNELSIISKKREELNIKLSKVLGKRAEIEQQKAGYLKIIQTTPPRDYDEMLQRIRFETMIKIEDVQNFKAQTETIAELLTQIKADLQKIYSMHEEILVTISSELKEEYQL